MVYGCLRCHFFYVMGCVSLVFFLVEALFFPFRTRGNYTDLQFLSCQLLTWFFVRAAHFNILSYVIKIYNMTTCTHIQHIHKRVYIYIYIDVIIHMHTYTQIYMHIFLPFWKSASQVAWKCGVSLWSWAPGRLIQRRFSGHGDLERSLQIINESGGVDRDAELHCLMGLGCSNVFVQPLGWIKGSYSGWVPSGYVKIAIENCHNLQLIFPVG